MSGERTALDRLWDEMWEAAHFSGSRKRPIWEIRRDIEAEARQSLVVALHGVSTYDDCWCDSDSSDGGHTLQCLQVRTALRLA